MTKLFLNGTFYFDSSNEHSYSSISYWCNRENHEESNFTYIIQLFVYIFFFFENEDIWRTTIFLEMEPSIFDSSNESFSHEEVILIITNNSRSFLLYLFFITLNERQNISKSFEGQRYIFNETPHFPRNKCNHQIKGRLQINLDVYYFNPQSCVTIIFRDTLLFFLIFKLLSGVKMKILLRYFQK